LTFLGLSFGSLLAFGFRVVELDSCSNDSSTLKGSFFIDFDWGHLSIVF
jgi:hypothetical protein